MSLLTLAPAPRQAALISFSLQIKTTLAVAITASWELAALKVTGTGTTMVVLEVLKYDV